MLFIRQKKYLMPQTADTAALSRFFLAADEGRPSETLKVGFQTASIYLSAY